MLSTLFAIAIFSGCVALFYFAWRHERRELLARAVRLRQLQEHRASTDKGEVAEQFGVVSPEIVHRVLMVLAEVSEFSLSPEKVRVDPTRLRADDRLADDLGYDLDSLSYCELQMRLEKEFGTRIISSSDYNGSPTINDIVQLVMAARSK